MTNIDFRAVNDQIELLEKKRIQFKIIGICCGVTAIFPIVLIPLGNFIIIGWLACLVSGFVCRSIAVSARNEAMRLRLSIANLDPSQSFGQPFTPAPAPALPKVGIDETSQEAPVAPPKPAKAPKANTASRLDKARRRE